MTQGGKSKTLFLLICSGTKETEFSSTGEYDPTKSIRKDLDEYGRGLSMGRSQALRILKDPKTIYKNKPLGSYDWNKGLVNGSDFLGKEKGNYTRAIDLYKGRFYKGLGLKGKEKLVASRHHAMIISGIYGLLALEEHTQLYECPLEDLEVFQNHWKKGDLLTRCLIKYLSRYRIRNIVDLTAQQEYRNLVSWRQLSSNENLRVLHAHCKDFTGAESLEYLGQFLGEYLLELRDDSFDTKQTFYWKNCCATPSIIPPEGWPREESQRMGKIIREGEKYNVEFKASLTGGARDFLPNILANPLKYRCMKSICSLLNSKGGDLYIGISDDGKINGINNDLMPYYNTRNPEDTYLQVFDRVVVFYLGVMFSNNIRTEILTHSNKPLLKIHVNPSSAPAYLLRDEHGQPTREFWIRHNVTSSQLNRQQQNQYIKTRCIEPSFKS